MKIIVDKIPEKPEECCFAKLGFSGYYCHLRNDYLCTLHTLNRCDKVIGLDKLVAIEEYATDNPRIRYKKHYPVEIKEV